jgi:hypothetical protein
MTRNLNFYLNEGLVQTPSIRTPIFCFANRKKINDEGHDIRIKSEIKNNLNWNSHINYCTRKYENKFAACKVSDFRLQISSSCNKNSEGQDTTDLAKFPINGLLKTKKCSRQCENYNTKRYAQSLLSPLPNSTQSLAGRIRINQQPTLIYLYDDTPHRISASCCESATSLSNFPQYEGNTINKSKIFNTPYSAMGRDLSNKSAQLRLDPKTKKIQYSTMVISLA